MREESTLGKISQMVKGSMAFQHLVRSIDQVIQAKLHHIKIQNRWMENVVWIVLRATSILHLRTANELRNPPVLLLPILENADRLALVLMNARWQIVIIINKKRRISTPHLGNVLGRNKFHQYERCMPPMLQTENLKKAIINIGFDKASLQ